MKGKATKAPVTEEVQAAAETAPVEEEPAIVAPEVIAVDEGLIDPQN